MFLFGTWTTKILVTIDNQIARRKSYGIAINLICCLRQRACRADATRRKETGDFSNINDTPEKAVPTKGIESKYDVLEDPTLLASLLMNDWRSFSHLWMTGLSAEKLSWESTRDENEAEPVVQIKIGSKFWTPCLMIFNHSTEPQIKSGSTIALSNYFYGRVMSCLCHFLRIRLPAHDRLRVLDCNLGHSEIVRLEAIPHFRAQSWNRQ